MLLVILFWQKTHISNVVQDFQVYLGHLKNNSVVSYCVISVILSEWTCLINQAKLQAPTLQGCANVYAMNIEKDYENICK